MRPKATLVWLNYNSSNFLGLALRSLKSLLQLDYDDYEVVIVDNASNDGSFEAVKKFVEGTGYGKAEIKVVRSDVNRGYSGGMNLGWRARDPESKYVVFLNNDLIVEPDSLREIIEYMEADEKVGAANGLILLGDGRTVYSAGGFVTELLSAGGICQGVLCSECYGKDVPHYVTYADGAYMVVKADAIKKACPGGKPFFDEAFMYFDDEILGLLLWNRGYQVKYYPVKAGLHHASSTIKPGPNYYGLRAGAARMVIVETALKAIAFTHVLGRLVKYSLRSLLGSARDHVLVRGVYDGLRLGLLVKKEVGTLSLYKAPYVRLRFEFLIPDSLRLCRGTGITHRDLVCSELKAN
jgi:GT2 family glycosyltransferase